MNAITTTDALDHAIAEAEEWATKAAEMATGRGASSEIGAELAAIAQAYAAIAQAYAIRMTVSDKP